VPRRDVAELRTGRAAADPEQVRDQTLRTQTALGPRLAGLLIVCMALFALATLAGLIANAAA
jgi:hypothetical protein